MSSVLTELIELLHLEPIEQNIYRGQSQDLGFPQLYGGQVIGQALSAAEKTVDESRFVHSFHCYFLLRGDATQPVVYLVEAIRDGRSYNTRRVKAVQGGKTIFHLTASFHKGEDSFEHQFSEMPQVAPPEKFTPEHILAQAYADEIPGKARDYWTQEMPIEMRRTGTYNPMRPKPHPPESCMWIRANGELPEETRVHQHMLAYASDMGMLRTATRPHGVHLLKGEAQIATIDHAMWFHRPFRIDEWLLFKVVAPTASGGRTLTRGEFFNQRGELVASTMQEGVFRKGRKPKT